MMKMKRLAIVALCLMCAGCTGLASNGGGVPLDKVVLDNFHALTIATERQFFEEFVKYRVLGSTFDLYDIGDSSIEVGTTEGVTDTGSANFTVPLPMSKGVGLTKTIAVNSGDTGKLTIALSSVANDPKGYKEVKKAFDAASPGIFETINKDDETFDDVCTAEAYCFKIPNDHEKSNYAYLKDVKAFRRLIDVICELDPPKPAPDAATRPKKKDAKKPHKGN